MINKNVLRHFGLERPGFWRDREYNQLVADVGADILDNQMVVISGKWGMGKSVLFREVRRAMTLEPENSPIFVRVASEEKEKVTIGTIMNAMLYDLTQESPRQNLEARTRQVIRVIGEMVKMQGGQVMGRPVVVFIENAQRLHVNTIRSLKDFREHDYNGEAPLFSMVLIGQEDLMEKVNRYGEVRCRTVSYELCPANNFMTAQKREQFIKSVFGEAVQPEARRRIANVFGTPLGIVNFIEQKMKELKRAGITEITTAVIDDLPLKEYYFALQENVGPIGYREISEKAGMALGSVSNAMNGYAPQSLDKIKAAMQDIENERAGGEFRKAVNSK